MPLIERQVRIGEKSMPITIEEKQKYIKKFTRIQKTQVRLKCKLRFLPIE